MKNNYSIVVVLLFYYVVLCYSSTFEQLLDNNFPKMLFGLVYMSIFSITFNLRSAFLLILTTFIFLVGFFSFMTFGSFQISDFNNTLYLNVFAIKFYYLFLAPFAFFGSGLNYFELVKYFGRNGGNSLSKFLIPILIKKELIASRYKEILFAMKTRGFEVDSRFSQVKLLPNWIVPLIVTTIMEGVESYDYNRMLKTKITKYKYDGYLDSISSIQIIFIIIGVVLFIIKFFTWLYI